MNHPPILLQDGERSDLCPTPIASNSVEPLRVRIVGTGKAASSLRSALDGNPSILLSPNLRRGDDLTSAASDVDIVVLAVPDGAIAEVAQQIAEVPETVVAHLSGATTLKALLPHARRASLHPLVPMTDPEIGAQRLRGAWMTAAGDRLVERLAEALDARVVRVNEVDRAIYHATAVVASNHLIALLGQVERLAKPLGVPLDAFMELASAALESSREIGPARALPGPVSRGDWQTVRAHIEAIPPEERSAYIAMAKQAAVLAQRPWPDDINE